MTPADGDSRPEAAGNWKLNLAILWAGNFLITGSATMVIPFLPLYLAELGVTDAGESGLWAGAIFAAHYLSLFICQPIWGTLADRFGRKPMLLRAGFGMAVVVATMGLAQTPLQLLLLRLLNGTFAGFSPSATSIVSTNTPQDRIGFAMGALHSGTIAGTVTGPLLGGLLEGWLGLRGVFSITGSVMFLAAVGMALWVKDRHTRPAAREAGGSTVLGGLRILCRRKEMPALLAVSLLIQFSLTGSLPFIPLFVQQLHGDGRTLALYVGLVSSVTGVSNMIFSPLLGRLPDRTDPRRVLLCSMGGACLVVLLHAAVTAYWQLLLLRGLLGIFIGGLIPTVRMLIKRHVPQGMETRAYSFDTSAVSLGSVLGPIVSGAAFGMIGLRAVFLLSACLMLANACWTWATLGGSSASAAGKRMERRKANTPM